MAGRFSPVTAAVPDPGRPSTPLSAAGCLDFLWPALSAFPVSVDARRNLQIAAARLLPVPRLALELHLCSDRPPDLHQLLPGEARDWALAADRLDDVQMARSYPSGLAAQLRAGLATGRAVDLFFEWDHAHLGAPSAHFFPCDQSLGEPTVPEPLLSLAAAGLGAVANLGTMSSRGDLLRVNVCGIPCGRLAEVLARLEWIGQVAPAEGLFDELCEMADKVNLALNYQNGRIQSGLGLEISLDQSPIWEPRWRSLFELLLARALCNEAEIECLLAIEACVQPWSFPVPWPAPWILAARIHSDPATPMVSRGLSHLKINLPGIGPAHAKAYVRAEHCWQDERSRRPPSQAPTATTRGDALRAARAFLRRHRQQSGWWREFRFAPGSSNQWTTAVVGCALLESGGDDCLALAHEAARRLLKSQHPTGGWGWNELLPPDADSTAWVLRLLLSLKSDSAAVVKGSSFLQRHCTVAGGIATYLGEFFDPAGCGDLGKWSGWIHEHDCVLANAAPFLGDRGVAALADRQQADGSWKPYWWESSALATALAAEALADDPRHAGAVRRALAWARNYRPDKPSAFVDACLIRILLLDRDGEAEILERRLTHLYAQQMPDGSWPPDSDMRLPASDDQTGERAPEPVPERFGIFTTATVLAALVIAERRLAERKPRAFT